jgi:tetratricopeptide (TPR) repeat protein
MITDEWLPANRLLVDGLLELREFDAALAHLGNLQAEYPNDLTLAKLRLAALHGLGRQDDATTYYFDMRPRLKAESGEHAAEHLRQFHDRLYGVQQRSPARGEAAPVCPRQLPPDNHDFVGRRGLLDELDAAAAIRSGPLSQGIVIINGMAGVGKTALALRWAHRVRDHFPDGDFYVNLGGFSGGAQVPQSTVVDDFLIALGYPPDNSTDARSRELSLSRLLASRRMLVLLDNARDTAHVKNLVPLLTSCLVIVTSRQGLTRLSVATGARRIRVEPMSITEASELLTVRLGERQDLVNSDRARLVELCCGLPLVITLLADHITSRPAIRLSDYASQLDRDQLVFHVGEDGDGSPTAQSFFSWSYRSLAEPEQRLFRLLGLHPGPDISIEAACACNGRPAAETSRSLRSLVGAHLIEQCDQYDRYRFHDLIREFARHCASQDETPEARRAAERRTLGHYLAAAHQAYRTLYPSHLTAPELPIEDAVNLIMFASKARAKFWLDRERTNLIAAVRYASVHEHHDQSWRLADTVSTIFDRQGYYLDSRALLELAVTSAKAAGDHEAEASSLVGLGMVLTILGEHSRARKCLEAGLRFAEDDDNERGQASTLHQLARLEMARGEPAAAIPLFRRSLDFARRIGDHEVLCWTHSRLGEALRITEQYDAAIVELHQAQFHAQCIDESGAIASTLSEIGSVYRDRGDYNAAAVYSEEAFAAVERLTIPDLAIVIKVHTTLAEIHLDRHAYEPGATHALRAISLAERAHNARAEARAREILGDIYLANGVPDDASAHWRLASELYERIGNSARCSAVRAKVDEMPIDSIDLPRARTTKSSSFDITVPNSSDGYQE